jgi:hypothetical protein
MEKVVPDERRLNDAISDRMLERLASSTELSQIRHRVQVTSFGGSGTTALLDHFLEAGVDAPATPGSFPFKHQRVPPANESVPPGFRVVYPYGDPRDAVVSVFRRSFQGGHYRGMRLRKPSPEAEHHLTDLEHFLDGGVDEFEMQDHFDRWFTKGPRAYPVLFVRFEDLPQVWPTVCDFVGLPASSAGLTMRPRASEWSSLPTSQRDAIDAMYGELARRLAALPPVEVR